MRERRGEVYPLVPEPFTADELASECDYWVEQQLWDDPYISAFAEATAAEIREGELDEVLQFAQRMRSHPLLSPRDVINLLRPAVQKQVLRRDPVGFPSPAYQVPTAYRDHLRTTLNDPDGYDELVYDMGTRNIQSNIGDRYKAHKLLMHSLWNRLGPAPRLLDVGCSELHGPIKLMSDMPFGEIEVVEAARGRRLQPNPVASHAVNDLMKVAHVKPAASVGVDILPRDVRSSEWVAACTLRPKELEDPSRRHEFSHLHRIAELLMRSRHMDEDTVAQKMGQLATGLPNITAHLGKGGFNEQGMASFHETTDIKQFEVVTFTTMLYMLTPAERRAAQALARRYLAPNGVIIYQDFARPHPQGQATLKFFPRWTAFKYRTMVEFAGDSTPRLYEVFQWETGRCMRMQFGPDWPAFLAAAQSSVK